MFANLSQENCRSSVVEKLDPDLRRQIDFLILENLFPTLRALWLHFELGKKGVSYIAMYRYARHLRDRTNRAEIAQIAADSDLELTEKVGIALSQCVLQKVLDNDELDPRDLKRLASTLRLTSRMGIEKKHLSERYRLAWARLELDNKSHQLSADKLQLFRERFGPDAPKSLPIASFPGREEPRPVLQIARDDQAPELLAASLPRPHQEP